MSSIEINRAPVLTLWAAVVAQRLGHAPATALSLGRALAAKTAFSKGQAMGLAEWHDPGPVVKATSEKAQLLPFMGRHVTLIETALGPLAVHEGKPVTPASVESYLAGKFGDALGATRSAMEKLAASRSPAQLGRTAFGLYEKFRPKIPTGTKGWGAEGVLDLTTIEKLAGS
jgi:hypothetical protein